NHLFGAVAEVVEHVEYRFGEEELTAAIGLHPELVPEQLLPAIAAPVALHEDGIAVHWLAGPLRHQRAAGIEPPHLCGEVRLPSLSVAVGPGANGHLQSRNISAEIADLELLRMFPHVLPEELTTHRPIRDHAG